MKTSCNFILSRSLAMLALFTVLFTYEVHAQTEADAFYIYQNDGHFDGFFYDDVIKMTYSYLDTLGVEHNE